MRLKWLIGIILSLPIIAAAQPSQFTGLLTSTTDLTCAGVIPCSTWPMPANPAQGSSYTDTTWGTTTWNLAAPPANTAGATIPVYSRYQHTNSDGTLAIFSENGHPYMDLYNCSVTPCTPINRITTSDGTLINPSAGDALWANTVRTRIYYIPWGYYSGVGPGGNPWLMLAYVDVSTCTTSSCVLTPTYIHTFSCTTDSYAPSPITSGSAGTQIESSYTGSQGGMMDSTDTYFSFSCDLANGSGTAEVDLIRYNRISNTVATQVKWYTICTGSVPSGCDVWTDGAKQGYDMFRMTQAPSSSYIALAFLNETQYYTPHVGAGTWEYGPTFNTLGILSNGNTHQDMGYDVNGVPTWVGVGAYTGSDADFHYIEITNMTTVSSSSNTSKVIALPCPFAYFNDTGCTYGSTFLEAKVNASHISMQGTNGITPGYALYSTMTLAGENGSGYNVDEPISTTLGTSVSGAGVATVTPGNMANIAVGTVQLIDKTGSNPESVTVTSTTSTTFTATFAYAHLSSATVSSLAVGDTGPFAMENFAVKIDTTATNGSAAQVWRISRAMSIRDACYQAEPHSAPDRNFTKIFFGSDWNVDPSGCSTGTGGVNTYENVLSGTSPSIGSFLSGFLKGVMQ